MLRSMTGYGRGEGRAGGYRITVEIKSLNHRFLDLNIRLPRFYLALEEKMREKVKSRINRGRIEVIVNIDQENGKKQPLTVDMDLAIAYYNALKELAQRLNLPADMGAKDLLGLPEVVKTSEPEWTEEGLWPGIEAALEEALTQLLTMRAKEGARLEEELRERAEKVRSLIKAIEERAHQVPGEYAEKLRQRIRELAGDLVLDPSRLEMEVALFAERADIREEVVRLHSHLDQFLRALDQGGAVGRQLDFLLQEMGREAHTISAKANDLMISNWVISLRGEMEKMREQVQNVE